MGRLAEVLGERGDPINIGLDRVGREIAEFHLLDHSLAQVAQIVADFGLNRGHNLKFPWFFVVKSASCRCSEDLIEP
jgi:hypothetical protein